MTLLRQPQYWWQEELLLVPCLICTTAPVAVLRQDQLGQAVAMEGEGHSMRRPPSWLGGPRLEIQVWGFGLRVQDSGFKV